LALFADNLFTSRDDPAGIGFCVADLFAWRFSMRRFLAGALLVAMTPLFALSPRSQKKDEVAKTSLKVGDEAPDFALLSDQWKPVKLSEYRGKKNVFLAVYVLAFTGG
jgi:hypothetical protein